MKVEFIMTGTACLPLPLAPKSLPAWFFWRSFHPVTPSRIPTAMQTQITMAAIDPESPSPPLLELVSPAGPRVASASVRLPVTASAATLSVVTLAAMLGEETTEVLTIDPDDSVVATLVAPYASRS